MWANLVRWLGVPLVKELLGRLIKFISREIEIQKEKREIKRKKKTGNPSDDFDNLS